MSGQPERPTVDARPKLRRRVEAAAQAVLSRRGELVPVDVLVEIGWVPSRAVDQWRAGRVDHLAQVVTVSVQRLVEALDLLRAWARTADLRPSEIDYVSATPDRRPLRFTAGGDAGVERAFRTHWTSPTPSAAADERLTKRHSAPPDLVVIAPLREWTCGECDGTGDLLIMERDRPLCLACADMEHLVFLPSGDAALTRRAKKASTLSAVVVRFSRAHKRYERQGLLVEQAALEAAEAQCLGDEDARLWRRERDRERRAAQDVTLVRRMTQEIIRLYPGCPAARAAAIAERTALRGSGRVGRSAAGRALAEDALTQAVIASIRHDDTDYDTLLMAGVPRDEARHRVRDRIDRVLDLWCRP